MELFSELFDGKTIKPLQSLLRNSNFRILRRITCARLDNLLMDHDRGCDLDIHQAVPLNTLDIIVGTLELARELLVQISCGMTIRIACVQVQVFEEPKDVFLEEALDESVVETGVNKQGTDKSFDKI